LLYNIHINLTNTVVFRDKLKCSAVHIVHFDHDDNAGI